MRGFYLTYLRRELRHRRRHVLVVAAALGISAGLVMTVSAATTAVGRAQAALLGSLGGIGTGLTVTAPDRSPGAAADPGALFAGDLGQLPPRAAARIARLPHVTAAASGLRLSELRPSASGIPQTVTVCGIDTRDTTAGPLAAASIQSGHGLGRDARDEAVLAAGFAAASRLSAGSSVTVAGTRLKVAGIVRPGSDPADIYLPLATAQRLARAGGVNVVYVLADDAAHVDRVRREIARLLPGASVASASELAARVTSSLGGAASLAAGLGTWVSAATLAASVGLAAALTSAAVSRRGREFGTLKALGWPAGRVTRQVIGESAVTGVLAAAAGTGAGLAGIALVNLFAPSLSGTAGGASGQVSVRVTASLTPAVAGAATAVAVAGSLAAGALGAWRAARLTPAAAFTRPV